MSWMDSWSRPSKSQATPVPFYSLSGGASTPYCHSCGRVIGSRKTASAASAGTLARYCSSRCRARKPGKRDRLIEETFVRFLTGAETAPADEGPRPAARPRKAKGDPRILVSCRTVENAVFGHRRAVPARSISPASAGAGDDDADGHARQEAAKDREALGTQHAVGAGDALPADVPAGAPRAQSEDPDLGAHKTPSKGDRVEEDEQDWTKNAEGDSTVIEKRQQGQLRAQEREMVRCAARRGVVFGFLMPVPEGSTGRTGPSGRADAAEEGERRLCEAVMAGKVVEPSFAKGDWGIRWRE